MPDRVVREGIIESEKVNLLTQGAEIFYRRLMSKVDDFGRYHANPRLLLAALFPLQLDRVSLAMVSNWLTECAKIGVITIYTVSGKQYLEIRLFGQRIRQMRQKWPPPSGVQKLTVVNKELELKPVSELQADDGRLQQNAPTRASESESESESELPKVSRSIADVDVQEIFTRMWAKHPKKTGRHPAENALAQTIFQRPDDMAGTAELIERNHAAWCATDDWNRDGGKYVPKLENWLRDGDWLEAPPEPVKSQQSTMLSMEEQDRLVREHSERLYGS